MSRPYIAMFAIREVLHLRFDKGLSIREISRSTRVPKSTVSDCLKRAEAAGLTWPLPDDLVTDEALATALEFQPTMGPPTRELPDFAYLRAELSKKGVTLSLLWLEYREANPGGYGYSQFCNLYRTWAKTAKPTMVLHHVAGEKCFVDYSGLKIPIYDDNDLTTPKYGAEVFVATTGVSNLLFVCVTASQSATDWLESHLKLFDYLGAVPHILVPDNLKSGVTKPDRYEATVMRSYLELANHYHTTVIPTRTYKPRDKAAAEVGVQIAQRWILAPLRKQRFTSLYEANAACRELLDRLNNRPLSAKDGSRREVYEEIDRPAMLKVPSDRFDIGVYRVAKVSIDYHVCLQFRTIRHYYSVPYKLVGAKVFLRYTSTTVEIFHNNLRVASHRRDDRPGYSTDKAHMPHSHREYLDWPPSRIISWAHESGKSVGTVVEEIVARRPHPEQGYRSAMGIISLSRRYGRDRLEAACQRACQMEVYSYQSIKSILAKGLDRQPLGQQEEPTRTNSTHENLRGPRYYQ